MTRCLRRLLTWLSPVVTDDNTTCWPVPSYGTLDTVGCDLWQCRNCLRIGHEHWLLWHHCGPTEQRHSAALLSIIDWLTDGGVERWLQGRGSSWPWIGARR